jgi:hypothetical protein
MARNSLDSLGLVSILSDKASAKEVKSRLDAIGYALDALITQTNASTVVNWLDVDAAAIAASKAAPTWYVDSTGKAFTAP